MFFINRVTSFEILLVCLVQIICKTLATHRFQLNIPKNWSTYYGNRTLSEVYDFIVIGAGPAGCVLANRLTENPSVNVLLVEAGDSEKPLITDPPIGSPGLQLSTFNWKYATEPMANACLSMDDNRCNWPHGRGVGGSSIINYSIYTRGNRRDFDRWKDLGNDGWSYEDVLPYFKKSEDAIFRPYNPVYHGTGGPLNVEYPPFRSSIAEAFLNSAKMAGHNVVDYNGAEQIGVSYLQSNTKGGWRNTAAKAFLEPIIDRPNLHVLTKSRAVKLHFDDSLKRVSKVEIYHKRKIHFVRPAKETILSAGAFESPKLLMLSGIGPREDLIKLGIKVIKDLPVGKTLYEHVATYGPLVIVKNVTDNLVNLTSIFQPSSVLTFLGGNGPLTTSGLESLLYMKTSNSISSDPGYPDIELIQALSTLGFDLGYTSRPGIRLSKQAYEAVFKPLENQRSFQYLPMLLHPRSKGFLKLKSKNPFHHPLLYANFFKDPRDLDTILEGIREAIRITSQKPFQQIGAELYEAKVPGCEGLTFNTDEYWKCYIMHLTATIHHQVSTCKMGPEFDASTVVNPRAMVHGFENLRVADIGIIPEPPSAHTAAYSYMIGERVADFIKYTWDLNPSSEDVNIDRKKRSYDWQKIESSSDPSRELKKINFNNNVRGSEVRGTGSKNWTKVDDISNEFNENERMSVGDVGIILWGRDTKEEKTTERTILQKYLMQPSIRNRSVDQVTEIPQVDTTAETEPAIERIMKTAPSINEDLIRTVTLKDNEQYGKGTAKPKLISLELAKMNSTEYSEEESTSKHN